MHGSSLTLPAPWGPIALVGANLFIVCFGATWGPVVWVLLGEMFPNSIRAAGMAVAAAAQWIANFVITTTFPPLSRLGLPYAYGLYTVLAAVSFVFVLTAVRETKGRSLEDMEELNALADGPGTPAGERLRTQQLQPLRVGGGSRQPLHVEHGRGGDRRVVVTVGEERRDLVLEGGDRSIVAGVDEVAGPCVALMVVRSENVAASQRSPSPGAARRGWRDRPGR